jgi:hypothetical protein
MFLRIRGNRASLVETYRQDGHVKQRHLFRLCSPNKDKHSFTFDVLRAKRFFNLTGKDWERLLAAAAPYLDWDRFGRELRDEVSWDFPYGIWRGPLVTQLDLSRDWAYDL